MSFIESHKLSVENAFVIGIEVGDKHNYVIGSSDKQTIETVREKIRNMYNSEVMGKAKLSEMPDDVYFGTQLQLSIDKKGEVTKDSFVLKVKEVRDIKNKVVFKYSDISEIDDKKCNVIYKNVKLSEALLSQKQDPNCCLEV